jgi:small subunit ribosomal protein S7
MPRRKRVGLRREIAPDVRFGSEQVQRFINKVMVRGKKSTAERIMYEALEAASGKLGEADHVVVLQKALGNVKPVLEVKSRRIGGATYQVPVEVSSHRQEALAMRWIIEFARGRKGMPMARALASELIDAYQGQGSAVKRREDTHKMAEANKAFAHYRW